MPWVEVNGIDIHYHDFGEGQPFVFLHGNSSCGEGWWQQIEHFKGRFRVLAYDSVNHGHSTNSPRDETEPDRADELEGFLSALNIERPVLAGNSMGGNTLIRWAARHPGEAAALIPSGSGIPPEAPGANGAPALRTTAPLPLETLSPPIGSSFTETYTREKKTLYERYMRLRATATRIEALRQPRQRAAPMPRERLIEAVKKITSPMLVVVGGLDRAVPSAKYLHELAPGSELKLIEGAPHNVYYEAVDEYNAAVDAFLSRVVMPAAAGG
jgi:pimeloyl-ACP methyl ester carboxylesterase